MSLLCQEKEMLDKARRDVLILYQTGPKLNLVQSVTSRLARHKKKKRLISILLYVQKSI